MVASLSKSYLSTFYQSYLSTFYQSYLPTIYQSYLTHFGSLVQGQLACCWEEPEGSSQRVAGGKEVHLPALKGSLPWGTLLRVLAALTVMHAIGCFAAWVATGKP